MRHVRSAVVAAAALFVVGAVVPAAQAASPGAPAPVTRPTASSSGSRSAHLSWTNPTSASFASTLVRYARGTSAPASPTQGIRARVVAKPGHALTVGGLVPGTQYAFALFASDGNGHFAPRATVGVTTGPAPVTDPAPFDHGSYVAVTWKNPTTRTFTGITVRYAKGRAPAAPTEGTGVPLSSATAAHAKLRGLAANTRYSVSIWAHDAARRYSTVATTRFTTRAMPGPDATISGTVTDSSGRPLAGVQVATDSYDLSSRRSAATDAAGRYSLTLPAGGYFLGFDGSQASGGNSDATGYSGYGTEVTVAPGETKSGVDAQLAAGAAVSGRVTDAAGHPLAGVVPYPIPVTPYVDLSGVFVFYSFDTSGAPASAADGTFTVKGLPATAVQICFDPMRAPVSGGDHDAIGYLQRCTSRSIITAVRKSRQVPDQALASLSGGVLAGIVTSATGRPAPNALVEIGSNDDHPESGFAYTSADGTYRVPLSAGRYQVCVDPSTVAFAPNYAGDAMTCGATAAVVHVGRTTTSNVQLTRGGAVAGRITGPGGKPLAEAFVGIEPINYRNGPGATAVTDNHGQYVAKGLAPGTYMACFEAPQSSDSKLPTGSASTCYRDKTRFIVRTGLIRLGIDARLGVGGAISGRVTDDQGNPLAGVVVDAESTTDLFGDYGYSFTRSDGTYTITSLRAGTYDVCFDVFDFSSAGTYRCYGASDANPYFGKPVSVHLGSTTRNINISLATGGSISVTVRNDHGNPIGGVDVTAVAPCDDRTDYCERLPLVGSSTDVSVSASDTAGADGTVTLTGLSPGTYAVCLFGYYGATAKHDSATGYADSCGGSGFDVTVTSHKTTVLTRTMGDGGEVRGTITDANGNPLAGVRVTVSNAAASDYLEVDEYDSAFGLYGPIADTVTGTDGTYAVHGVTPGSQTVCVDASQPHGGSSVNGYFDACVGGTNAGSATPIQVTAGERTSGVDLALVSGAGISGTVKNAAGDRLRRAEVMVFGKFAKPIGYDVTSRNGTYRISRLRAGTYRVCFLARGYAGQCYYHVSWNPSKSPPIGATKLLLTAGTDRKHVDARLHR